MKSLFAAALMLLCAVGSTAAQPVAGLAGSVVDQTGAGLPGKSLVPPSDSLVTWAVIIS
jgi:hypothetical protein